MCPIPPLFILNTTVCTQSELQVFALHRLSNQAGYRFGIGRIRLIDYVTGRPEFYNVQNFDLYKY